MFTNDLARAWSSFDELEVGGVIVNDIPTYRIDHMPYGGVKDSGLGPRGPALGDRGHDRDPDHGPRLAPVGSAAGPTSAADAGRSVGDADAYERYVGRWSRRVADEFVAWLGLPGRLRAGSTSAAAPGRSRATIVARTGPRAVPGVDPSPDFVAAAREHVTDPVASFAVGRADALPLEAGEADAVVSGLVLNFVPDVPAALAEAGA